MRLRDHQRGSDPPLTRRLGAGDESAPGEAARPDVTAGQTARDGVPPTSGICDETDLPVWIARLRNLRLGSNRSASVRIGPVDTSHSWRKRCRSRRSSVLALMAAMLVLPMSPSQADPASLECNASVATIMGTDGDDDLTGTDGPDVVWLGAGDDVFHGLGGGDQMRPGTGKNQIYAGPGNDYVYGVDNWDQNQVRTGKGDDSVLNSGGTFFLDPATMSPIPGSATRRSIRARDPTSSCSPAIPHVWLGRGADHAYLEYGSPAVNGGPGRDTSTSASPPPRTRRATTGPGCSAVTAATRSTGDGLADAARRWSRPGDQPRRHLGHRP